MLDVSRLGAMVNCFYDIYGERFIVKGCCNLILLVLELSTAALSVIPTSIELLLMRVRSLNMMSSSSYSSFGPYFSPYSDSVSLWPV